MNNSYDFSSKKYIFLLIIICFIFTILIIKAFDYLPEKQIPALNDNYAENVENQANTQDKTDVTVAEADSEQQDKVPEQKHGVLFKSTESFTDEPEFDVIDAPKGSVEEDLPKENNTDYNNNQLTSDDMAIKSVINARKYAANNDITKALNEYQKAAENTNDKEISAQCYEGMAELYAKQKKYSTALSFAGKAYNSSPSSSREVLIAQIYYAAGKTDVAVKRLNNLLKRGFNN